MTKIHTTPYRPYTPEVNYIPLLAVVAISTTGEETTISVDTEGNVSLPEGMSHGESLLLIAALITGNRIMDGGIYEATLRKWLPVETLALMVGTKMTWEGSREDSNKPATPEGDAISLSEVERAMLQSMAVSFRAGMDFSFNALDMANLMERCADLRSLPPQDGERLTDDGWIDAAVRQQKLVKLWKARCEQLWNAAWEHVEAFSILEDSVQIAARAKIEAILGQEAFPAALTAQPAAQEPVAQEPVAGAPERIWAWEGEGQDGWENAYATVTCVAADQVEYIRADLAHSATPAPVEAGLRESLLKWCDDRQFDVVNCLDLRADEEASAVLWIENFRAALRAQSAPVGGEPVTVDQACAGCGYLFNAIAPCKCGKRIPTIIVQIGGAA